MTGIVDWAAGRARMVIAFIILSLLAGARLASGREVAGRVTFLSRSADPTTRTFRVDVEVPNPDFSISDGQTAEIAIQSAGTTAHLLPQSALTLNDNGDLGVRLAVDNVATFAPVSVLRDTTEGIWVNGLAPNVDVIVVGQDFVESYGGRVAIAPLVEGLSTTEIINRVLRVYGQD